MNAPFKFTVNGQARTVESDPVRPLLDVLREDLQLTGTKYGCGEGHCGACTVLIDGKRAFSCRTTLEDVQNKSVTTIEGLSAGDRLHPVQQAFLDEDAYQCGYCIPGMIMNAVGLLNEKPNPSDQEIASWMNRNLCRCCGYPKIFNAVHRAAGAGRK